MKGNAIIMTKRTNMLIAEDLYAQEMLSKIPNTDQVKVTITAPRNLGHHRKFFILLNLVYDAQPEPKAFSTVDKLLDAIKVATGHVREFVDFNGNIHIVPDSISWGRMDQIAFTEFYNSAVDVVLEYVLPNCERADLEQQIFNILGTLGPDALRR